ncbi:hypothetical protein WMY93_001596 [Mugilogobius chulae]|uniref:ARMC5-like ARM-repeats domain-containing protein n=1 Tax=Mugilogobius chulae TaxID=88201 RepID=A0AAW0PZP7_9GOBI
MSSVSGGDRKLKPSSSKDPELSLTWCISKLSKKPDSSRDQDKRARMAQWRALVAIRTHHIKGHRSSISRFRREGGLALLLELLKQTDCSRKTLDLGLSILGNCCTERETCAQVRKLDGISTIVDIMKRQVALVSVQNRAARALGNLAMDPESSAQIHTAGGVPLLLLCLSQSSSGFSPSSPRSSSGASTAPSSPSPPATPDSSITTSTTSTSSSSGSSFSVSSSTLSALSSSPSLLLDDSSPALECAQSAAARLLYLCDSSCHRAALLSQGAITSLAPLVAPEFPSALRRAALRALHELTRGCGVECARQVARSGVLTQLGALATGEGEEEKEEEKAMQELALKSLANVCAQGCLRPLVGSLGVIRRFCEEVKKDALKSSVFLKALCLCCKEAVNRAKVKDCGRPGAAHRIHSARTREHPLSRLAIWACVDFVFDEVAMETLQDLGLVSVLVERLVKLCKGSQLPPADVPKDCLDSFDFPPPEEKKGALCSSSFLSLSCAHVSARPQVPSAFSFLLYACLHDMCVILSHLPQSTLQRVLSCPFSPRSLLLHLGVVRVHVQELRECAERIRRESIFLRGSSGLMRLPSHVTSILAVIHVNPHDFGQKRTAVDWSWCTRHFTRNSDTSRTELASSWLLSEGLISSEGDLLDSSSTVESDWSVLQLSSPQTPNSCASTSSPAPPAPPATSSICHKPPAVSPASSSTTPKTQDSTSTPKTQDSSSTPKTQDSSALHLKTKTLPPHLNTRLLLLQPKTQDSSSTPKPKTPPPHLKPKTPPLLLPPPGVVSPVPPGALDPGVPAAPAPVALLSRPGPSAALVNSGVMSGLILYLTTHPDPSARCFRLLLRLSENPNCLQALVRSGAAGMFQYQLCGGGEGEEREERGQERSRSKGRARESRPKSASSV